MVYGGHTDVCQSLGRSNLPCDSRSIRCSFGCGLHLSCTILYPIRGKDLSTKDPYKVFGDWGLSITMSVSIDSVNDKLGGGENGYEEKPLYMLPLTSGIVYLATELDWATEFGGLVLERSESNCGQYKRIGCFRSSEFQDITELLTAMEQARLKPLPRDSYDRMLEESQAAVFGVPALLEDDYILFTSQRGSIPGPDGPRPCSYSYMITLI